MPLYQHLEKIHGFLGVATYGSFRKAAEILAISQPSLSQSIAILEETLGTKLFTRSSRGVELTPEGMQLHAFALDLVARTSKIEQEITRSNSEKDWMLSVGSYESLAVHLWPQLLRHLQNVDPRLQINLITGRSSMIIEELMEGFLDAALCVDPVPHPRLDQHLIYEDSYGIYGRNDLVADINKITSSNLPDKQILSQHIGFVFSTASAGPGQNLEQLLWSLNIKFKKIQAVQSFEATAALIEEGLGLGILPHRIASHLQQRLAPIAELKLTDNETLWGRHRIELCSMRDKQFNPRLKSLHDHLKAWISRLEVDSFTCYTALDPRH
jgi:DNA-binding transcriptional LysR family regulator